MPTRPEAGASIRAAIPEPVIDPVISPLRARVRREIYEDPQQFLWAVSYADLLMVLMSFFVMYFQMSDEKPEDKPSGNPLAAIVLAVGKGATPVVEPPLSSAGAQAPGSGVAADQGAADVGAGLGAGTGAGASAEKGSPLDLLATQLGSNFSKVEKDAKTGSILINFPDDFFEVGHYSLNLTGQARVGELLDRLRPHANRIEITFIGHADASPIKNPGFKVIDSNLVLSNLRASKAVEFAMKRGFDPRWVNSQGVGEHTRNTRSLSVRIALHGDRGGGAR